jgi:hypothetical protein
VTIDLPAALALLLVLAACAAPAPPRPGSAEPEPPGIAACREEARRAPAAQAMMREVNVTNPQNVARLQAERASAEEQAFRDCLRRSGLAAGGGVERVQPRR